MDFLTSRVALVMAPLLPGIRMGVGNNGLENGGGGGQGGGLATRCEFTPTKRNSDHKITLEMANSP